MINTYEKNNLYTGQMERGPAEPEFPLHFSYTFIFKLINLKLIFLCYYYNNYNID